MRNSAYFLRAGPLLNASCQIQTALTSGFFHARPDDSLVKRRSVVDRNHLVDEVARVEHRDAHQPLDDELRLEQILAFLRQALQRKHDSGSHGSFLAVNSLVPLRGCEEGDYTSFRLG